jgi:hypothetical protein
LVAVGLGEWAGSGGLGGCCVGLGLDLGHLQGQLAMEDGDLLLGGDEGLIRAGDLVSRRDQAGEEQDQEDDPDDRDQDGGDSGNTGVSSGSGERQASRRATATEVGESTEVIVTGVPAGQRALSLLR